MNRIPLWGFAVGAFAWIAPVTSALACPVTTVTGQSAVAGSCSAISLTAPRAAGTSGALVVTLGGVGSGSFYLDAACTSAIKTVTLPGTQTTATVYFSDQKAESLTLTTSTPYGSTETSSGSLSFKTSPAAAAKLAFISGPASSAVAGGTDSTTVGITDAYGNAIASGPSITLAAYSDSACTNAASTPAAMSEAASSAGAAAFKPIPTLAGTIYFGASASGLPVVCSGAVTVGAAAYSSLTIVSGNLQTGPAGGTLSGIVVRAQDAYTNPVSGVTITFSSSSGGGSVLQSTAVTDPSGQAGSSFMLGGTLGIDKFSARGPSGSAVSFGETVTPAAPAALALAGPSSGSDGACAGPYTVTAKDAYGNVTTATSTLALSLIGQGSASSYSDSACSNAAFPVIAGGASTGSFYLSDTKVETLSLSIGGVGLTSSSVIKVALSAGTATQLVFSTQPGASATAGKALAQAPVVTIQDAFGNTVASARNTIALAAYSDPGCYTGTGTQAGGSSKAASSGSASFTSLSYTVSGPVYFGASSSGLAPACSSAVTVAPGAVSQLAALSGNLQAGPAGSTIAASVSVLDAYGNAISGASVNFTASTSGASVSPPSATSDPTGAARTTFTLGTKPGTDTFKASAPGATAATFTETVTAAAPASLALSGSSKNTAGACAGPYTVTSHDTYGNIAPASSSIALTLGGQGSANTYLDSACANAGSPSIAAGAGTATFYLLDTLAESFTLSIGAQGLTGSTLAVTVAPAAGTQLVYSVEPAGSGTAGSALSPQPTLVVQDSYGNTATSARNTITLAAFSDAYCMTPATSGTVGGGSRAANSGVAAFGSLSYTRAAAVYFGASSTGLGNACSSAVTISAASASQLLSAGGDHQTGAAGTPLAGAAQVTVLDRYTNPVSGASVAFSASSGGGSVLQPQPILTDSSGNAFATLILGDKPGTDTFKATLSGVGTVSFTETVVPAAPAALTLTGPGSGSAGTCAGPFTVTSKDAYGDVSATVSALPLSAGGLGSAQLFSDSACATPAAALAIAANASTQAFYLQDTQAETLTLSISSGTLTAGSLAYTSKPGSAVSLAFSGEPGASAVAGSAFSHQPMVTAFDAFGNVATSFRSGVTLAAFSDSRCQTSASGTLGGASVGASSGVASFTSTYYTRSGTLYLSASASGLANACSSAIQVGAGADDHLLVVSGTGQTGVVGSTLPSPAIAQVLDKYGNPVPGVTIAFTVTAGTMTVNPTSAVSDSNGLVQTTMLLGSPDCDNTLVFGRQSSPLPGNPATVTFNERTTPLPHIVLAGPSSVTAGSCTSYTVTTSGHVWTPIAPNCTEGVGYYAGRSISKSLPDVVTPKLPILLGFPGGNATITVADPQTAYDILTTTGPYAYALPEVNGLAQLYAQELTAKLSIAYGANGAFINDALTAIDAYLADHAASGWCDLFEADQTQVWDWYATLYNFNYGNQAYGPGTCPGPGVINTDPPLLTVDLYGSDFGGFYSDPACTQAITSVSFPPGPPGYNTTNFYFKDTVAESVDILEIETTGAYTRDPSTQPVRVTGAAPASLAFTLEPQPVQQENKTFVGGVTVSALDPYGNITALDPTAVTLSPAADVACANPASGVLKASKNPVTTSNGSASFSGLSYSQPGYMFLAATAPGLAPACSTPVGIQNGTVGDHLQYIAGNNQSAPEGMTLPTNPQVELLDVHGNPVPGVTLVFTVETGGGHVGSIENITDQNGFAQTAYTLGTKSEGDTMIVGGLASQLAGKPATILFTETTIGGAPATLAFSGPSSIVAATCDAFSVGVKDAKGNTTSSPSPISIALGGFGTGAFYSDVNCTNPVTSITLPAATASIAFHIKGLKAEYLVLTGTASGFPEGTLPYTVVPSAPVALAFTSQPNEGEQMNVEMRHPRPVVSVLDAEGNQVNEPAYTLSLAAFSDASCTTPAPGTLTLRDPHRICNGSVVLDGTSYSQPGTIYLQASTPGLASACSTFVSVYGNSAANRIEIAGWWGDHHWWWWENQKQSGPPPWLSSGTQWWAGNNEWDAVGTYTRPMITKVVDASGVGVPGFVLNYTITSGGGSLESAQATTDAAGFARDRLLLPTTPGQTQVTVSSPVDLPGKSTVVFTENAVGGKPIALAISEPASPTAAGACSGKFVVDMTDGYGNVTDYCWATPYTVSGTGSSVLYSDAACTQALSGPYFPGCGGVGTFYMKDTTAEALLLTVSSPNLTSATAAFTFAAGPPAALAFSQEPSASANGGAFFAIQPTVRISDSYGNLVTGATSSIQLSAATDSACGVAGTGTLTATSNPLAASGGYAAFSGVSYSQSGALYLKATSSGLAGACSTGVGISGGTADHLVLVGGNGQSGASGTALAVSLSARVVDSSGNPVAGIPVGFTVTGGGGFVNPPSTISSSQGLVSATYTLGTVDGPDTVVAARVGTPLPGGPATLIFSETGISGAASSISLSGPSSTVAGACAGPFSAGTFDAFQNPANVTASLALSGGGVGAFYSDAACASPISSLTFASASTGTFYFRDSKSETPTLTASAPGLSQGTLALTVNLGAPFRLVFVAEPPAASLTCAAFASQPSVMIQDKYGNLLPGASDTVTLSAATDSQCGSPAADPAALTGAASQPTSAGVASFSGLGSSRPGTYYLKASSAAGLQAACSSAVGVSLSAPARVAFTSLLPAGATAGAPFAPQPSIAIQDACGNAEPSASGPVTLGAFSDQLCKTPATGVFTAALNPLATNAGVAAFTGVSYQTAAFIYLGASAPGVASSCTQSFLVQPAAPDHLVLVQGDAQTAFAGTLLPITPEVQVVDHYGNGLSGISLGYAVTTGQGTFVSSAIYSDAQGMTADAFTLDPIAGTNAFTASALTVSLPGAPKTVSFTETGIAGPGANLLLTGPASLTTSACSAAYTIQLTDTFGNATTAAADTSVGLSGGSGLFYSDPACTTQISSVTVAQGTGTATTYYLDAVPETATLDAASAGYADGTESVAVVGPNQVAFSGPSGLTAGQCGAYSLTALTQTGAPAGVLADSLFVLSGYALGHFYSAAGCVAGTEITELTLARGQSAAQFWFEDDVIPGGRFIQTFFGASNPTLPQPGQFEVEVTVAPAYQLAFSTEPPATAQAGIPLTTNPVILFEDKLGNYVFGTGGPVTLKGYLDSACTIPGTGTLGTGSQNPANGQFGSASFSSVSYTLAGSLYLGASTPGLASACSTLVTVTGGQPDHLILVQGNGVTASVNAVAVPNPQVQVVDAFGNPVSNVSIQFVVTPAASIGSVAPGVIMSDASGLASTSWQLGTASGSNAMTAQRYRVPLPGTPATISFSDTAKAGDPTQLLVVGPNPVAAGACAGPYAFKPEDRFGNVAPITSAGAAALSSGSGSFYSDAGCTSAVSSLAFALGDTVKTLYFRDTKAESISLSATLGSLTPVSQPVVVQPGPPAQIGFTTEPSSSVQAGVPLAAPPVAAIQDQYGNTVTTSSASVALAAFTDSACTAAGTSSALGASANPIGALSGVAGFSGVNYTLSGTIYLQAASSGITSACSSAIVVTGAQPDHLILLSGNSQTATVNQLVPVTPQVKVVDQYGNGIPNVALAFGITGGNGTLASATVTSDANGLASDAFKLGQTAGANAFTVGRQASALPGAPSTLTFSETGTPDVASALAVVAPGQQNTGVCGNISLTTADQFGNVSPVGANTTIAFGGQGSGLLSAGSSCGGGPSLASGTVTAGTSTFALSFRDTIPETVNLTATVFSNTKQIPISIQVGPAAQLVFAVEPPATNQAGISFSSEPVVWVTDAFGNIEGKLSVPVTLASMSDSACTVPTTQGTLSADQNPLTTNNSVASFTNVQFTKAGPLYLAASASGLATACSSLVTITGGVPDHIVKVAGDGQTGTAGVPLPMSAQVHVVDANGNTVTGVQVQFSAVSGGGAPSPAFTTTDGTGTASTVLTLGKDAGIDTFVAGRAGTPLPGAPSTVTFTETGIAGPPTMLTLATVAQATAGTCVSLTVGVQDQFKNPALVAANASIPLTPVGSEAYFSDNQCANAENAATIAAGAGSVTYYLSDKVAESLNLAVSYGSLTGATATLKIVPGAPAQLGFSTEPSATANAGVALAQQPVVAVQDAYGNTVSTSSGDAIELAAMADSACTTSLSTQLTVTTDPVSTNNGTASFAGVAYDASGPFYLVAAAAGLTQACSAQILINPGTADHLVIVSGNGETAVAGSVVAVNPDVEVVDFYGNAVSGQTVDFTVGSGSGTLGTTVATTNANGMASTTFTTGTVSGTDTILVRDPAGLPGTPATLTLTETGVAGPASLLAFSGAATTDAGTCIPYSLTLQDSLGNVTNAASTFAISFSGLGSGAYYPTSNCTPGSALSSASIPGGASSVNLYLLDNTAETLELALSTPIGVATLQVTVNPAPPSQLGFLVQPPASSVAGATFSPAPIVAAEDLYGNAVAAASGEVYLAAYSDSLCTVPVALSLGTFATPLASGLATFAALSEGLATTFYLGATSGTLNFACSSAVTITPSVAHHVLATAGNGQSASVGTAVATAPVVRVVDVYGNGVNGTLVNFSLGSGGGSVGTASVTTSGGGFASTSFTLGTVGGTDTMTATPSPALPGNPASITFSETAVAGAPVTLALTGPASIWTGKCNLYSASVSDSYGNATTEPASQSFALASTGTGQFFFDSGCTLPISGTTISAGSGSSSFFYESVAAESASLSISASGYTGASESVTSRTLAKLAFAPAGASFSGTTVGTSASQAFTITNSGGTPATGAFLKLSTGTQFSISGNSCGSAGSPVTVGVGASCAFTAVFAPTAAGTLSDTLTVTYNDGSTSNQTATAAVGGVGVTPALLAFSPSSYAFGSITVGANAQQTFALANSGGSAATGVSISLASGTQFTLSNNNCGSSGAPVTIPALGSCSFTGTFAPTAASPLADTLRASYANGVQTGLSATGQLSGTGLTPAVLAFSPSSWTVSAAIGGTATQTFTITNSGQSSATAVYAAISGDAPFTTTSSSCGTSGAPVTIASGGSCSITGSYAPTAAVANEATIALTYANGAASGQAASASLSGTGLTPASLAFSPSGESFGNVSVGSSVTQAFTISNSGAASATGVSISISGTGFALTSNTCGISSSPVTIAGGGSCAFVAKFAPTVTGTTNGSVSLSYNNGASAQNGTASISGTGVNPPPVLASLSPTSLKLSGGSLLLTGTSFLSGATVTVGSTACGSVSFGTSTSLSCTAPALAAGTYGVFVTNPDGQSSATVNLTYNPAPTISSVSPYLGPISGGTAVVITGTGFLSGATVTFGGSAATGVSVASSTSITATTPSGTVGAVNVVVTNTDTQIGTLANGFTYTTLAIGAGSPVGVGVNNYACAAVNGGASCWGLNTYGNLGNNSTLNPVEPVTAVSTSGSGTLAGVESVTNGWSHSCAVSGGAVYCWGYNNHGQLGNGTTTNSSIPVLVSGLPVIATVYAGEFHTCALSVAGNVYCWGYNAYGQLGNNLSADLSSPVEVKGTSGSGFLSNIVSIATGSAHSCAVSNTGLAYCWGYDGNGQLGIGSANNAVNGLPIQVSNITGIASIAAGYLHTCAINTNKNLYCWGYNLYGALGNGSTSLSTVPVTVLAGAQGSGNLSNVAWVTGGEYHTCAATTAASGGNVYCWGNNTSSQLGNNLAGNQSVPVKVVGTSGSGALSAITAVASGNLATETCAINASSNVYCWGSNTNLSLGSPGYTLAQSLIPVEVGASLDWAPAPSLSSISPASGSSAGGYSATITGSGFLSGATVTIGGSAATGVTVVSSSTITLTVPSGTGSASVVVTNLDTRAGQLAGGFSYASQVAVGGDSFACATVSGNVECWANNNNGQLGYGSTLNPPQAVEVHAGAQGGGTFLSGIGAVSTGQDHACAVASSGNAYCWGANSLGQLGNSTVTSSNVPVQVSSLTGVAAVSTGYQTSCALTTSGNVYCWGSNNYGEVGNNSATASFDAPAEVVGAGGPGFLSNVTSLANGTYHTCALTAYGNVYCWGYNYYGGLGNSGASTGGTANPYPYQVLAGAQANQLNLSNVTAIAAGNAHTCAVSGGNVYCWGYDAYGQLGNNTNNGGANSLPVQVVSTTGSGVLSGIVGIAAGQYYSCALSSAGNVYCWGLGTTGQLGGGVTTTSYYPVEVSGAGGSGFLSGMVGISANGDGNETCATNGSGNIYCWGSNTSQDFGAPTFTSANSSLPIEMTISTDWAPAPTIASVSPATGSDSGGTSVTLTGTGFLSGAKVTIGGVSGTNVTVVSPTTITLTTPPGMGTASILVTNTDSLAAQLPGGFAYSSLVAVGGDSFACATNAGNVQCWGNNALGQLGDSSTLSNPEPVSVLAGAQTGQTLLSNVNDISSGFDHTCATASSGNVYCWGAGNLGQLGNGTTASSTAPVQVSSLTTATEISAGYQSSCALTTTGNAYCWGNNNYGQVGSGSAAGSIASPAEVVGAGGAGLLSNITSIASGAYFSCALSVYGNVYCWGYNYYGSVGNSSASSGGNANPTPYEVLAGAQPSQVYLSNVTAIAAGNAHACAVSGGNVYCWGYDSVGQLGNNTTNSAYNVSPSVVLGTTGTGALSGIVAISAGQYFTCALSSAGNVYCWGQDSSGQLGNGLTATSPYPVEVKSTTGAGFLSGIAGLVANNGGNEACASDGSGNIFCWGSNSSQALGDPGYTLATSSLPLEVSSTTDWASPPTITSISPSSGAAAGGYTATITGTGFLSGATVTIGGSSATNVSVTSSTTVTLTVPFGTGPASVVVTNTDSQVAQLAGGFTYGSMVAVGGDSFGCAANSGSVECWGQDEDGQLGNSSTLNPPEPVQVLSGAQGGGTSLSGAGAVVAGQDHACALSGGNVYCWGLNSSGQLGNNLTTTSEIPVKALMPVAATEIAANGTTNCALTAAGAVYCWGGNSYGQVGNDTSTTALAPAQVHGVNNGGTLSNITSLAVGSLHACALSTYGNVYCWGYNYYGSVGSPLAATGGNVNSVPFEVQGGAQTSQAYLSNVTAITAGNAHTCAISGGNVYCWGYDDYGQLGNNTANNAVNAAPIEVLGTSGTGALGGIVALTAGPAHTCALSSAGNVYCWGYNNVGQLGNGTTANSYYPVEVKGVGGSGVLSGITGIASNGGNGETCAVDSSANVYCWGTNTYQDLGTPGYTLSDTLVPIEVSATIDWAPAPTISSISPSSGSNAGGYSATITGTGFLAGATVTIGGLAVTGATLSGSTSISFAVPAGMGSVSVVVTNPDSQVAQLTGGFAYNAMIAVGGDSFACATNNGNVFCWGNNPYGELGNGATSSASGGTAYTEVLAGAQGGTYLSGIDSISLGVDHSCGVSSTGSVYCWGYNNDGQLGNGTVTNSSTPVKVNTLTTATEIAAGYESTCALTAAGTVYCWGLNNYGQLGNNSGSASSTAPVQVVGANASGPLTNITALAAGTYHNCALNTYGYVYCWGYNYYGGLGNSNASAGGNANPLAYEVEGTGAQGDLGPMVAIAAGNAHSCAVSSAGNVYCWGYDAQGELGIGGTNSSANTAPQEVLSGAQGGGTYLSNVVGIMAGETNTCAFTSGGNVYCWGGNVSGQDGNNTTTQVTSPVEVVSTTGSGAISGIVGIAGNHDGLESCGINGSGGLFCWGSNTDKDIGQTYSTANVPYPVAVGAGH